MAWTLDLTHSTVGFTVRHMVVAKVRGHFSKFSIDLNYVPENPLASSVNAVIEAASIDTKVEQRDNHLRSPDFFDVANFPTLTFASTSVKKTSDEGFEIQGNLTIRGITKPVTLEVEGGGLAKDPWGNTRTGFSAKTSILRKDFGLTWNQALETGGVLVGEKVEIELDLEVVQQAAAATV
jgi:polyisoprenoid-binding protein YceI